MEDYRTIHGTATGEYEEKKSRFIAALSFADSEEAAVAFLEQVRAANRTARHNVYAYRLREGNRERYSDDGEPAKTAGTPALEVLQHSGLTDLIVVVTRYFGGVLLGTGGLVRAYTTATARALENAQVVTVRSVVELQVTVDRDSFNYYRFVTHMHYMMKRTLDDAMIDTQNRDIFESMKKEYPSIYSCSVKVAALIEQQLKKSLSEEEILYLILHINRLCAREDCDR